MMKIENDEKFIKVVEGLVDPDEVQTIYFFQKFRKLLPKKLFKRLLIQTSKKSPYIGFIIEPYSLFLFFKITDVEKAKSMLPERYELTKASVFEGDEPDYYFGIGNLNTRGSTFWGIRLESYLIATDKETGLLSWIFFDILSNTIIAVPSEGIIDPNSRNAIFTTNSKGDVFLDIKDDNSQREVVLKCNINRGVKRVPEQELWVTGNTSIGHINDLITNNDDPFAVIFDPAEVSSALDIPPEDVCIEKNTIVPNFAEKNPCKIACFPFTQHYVADSPGCRTYIKNTKDLITNYNKMAGMKDVRPFSTKVISKLFNLVMIINPIISIILFILLLNKR